MPCLTRLPAAPFALATALLLASRPAAADLAFTFETKDNNFGAAVVRVAGDKFSGVDIVSGQMDLDDAFKLVRAGDKIAVSAKRADEHGIALFSADGSSPTAWVGLSDAVSELVEAGGMVFVAAARGRFFVVDPAAGETVAEINARRDLQPPARKGEDVVAFDGGKRVLATFQKDDDDTEAIGSRLAILDVSPARVVHDILLPRDREDLHISGNPKEQGPNPEKALIFEKSNTLALTLDLYGAVAFADWDAIQQGDLENYAVFSTAADGSWGTAFPDRALGFEWGGKEYLLVTNASPDGGLALFDVGARQRVAFYPASAGAETPVFLPSAAKIATVTSGKSKERGDAELTKSIDPGSEILIWDLAPAEPAAAPIMQSVDLGARLTRIAAADGTSARVVILAESDAGPEAILYDVASKKILDRTPLPGTPIRFER